MGRPANNLINQRFGKLVVLERDISKPSGQENQFIGFVNVIVEIKNQLGQIN